MFPEYLPIAALAESPRRRHPALPGFAFGPYPELIPCRVTLGPGRWHRDTVSAACQSMNAAHSCGK